MPSAEQSININASPTQIWDLVKNPNNWPTWFEGASSPNVLTGAGDVGTAVEIIMTVAKIAIPTTLTITETVPGEHWRGEFVSPGVTSGFMLWTYMGMGRRTKLTFHVEAELEGAAKIAQGRVIRGFEEMAEKTLQNLKSIMEG